MKIEPLAFDSLGVRSMATFVKTKDFALTIDPGVALGPKRHNLEPHPLEYREEIARWMLIQKRAEESDGLVVSHYHYDHYNPDKPEIFDKKIAFLKDPENKINQSQKRRSRTFISEIDGRVKSLEIADNREFVFGKTKIKFSWPTWHGTTPKLGYVLQTLVDDGKTKFIHTSDIEGPNNQKQIDFILQEKPNVVFMDGPMTYLMPYSYTYKDLEKSLDYLKEVLALKSIQTVVLDHHFMRDAKWNDRIISLYKFAKDHDSKVMPASRFIGKPLNMLESRRKELWQNEI